MNQKKKIFLLLSTYVIFLFTPKMSACAKEKEPIEYNDSYIYESTTPYAYCNGKLIYIVNRAQLLELLKDDKTGIFIIDDRLIGNSDMAIYESYRILNRNEMKDIINIMLHYETEYPSNWNRTATSMKNEWDIHNICYYCNIDRNSTKEVDFDNNDETRYDSDLITKILRN